MREMKAAGVIAEFNPFHNGHEYLLSRLRRDGFTHIAAVMSGNYTQRGEAAVMLKSARARAAIACGADIVLELPLPFAVSNAEKFAYGAVYILNSLGCIDSLCFGSECADTKLIRKTAALISEADGSPELARELKKGYSLARARANILGAEAGEILNSPNDTLAAEYVKAIASINSPIKPYAVKRVGARHDGEPSEYESEMFSSAHALRRMIAAGGYEQTRRFMPARAYTAFLGEIRGGRAPFSDNKTEPLMLASLRRMDINGFRKTADVSEGLENRIFKAVKSVCSLDDLYGVIKSKRYTMARIRRIILCAYLGIDASYTTEKPPYIRVLAFNGRGRELLKAAKEKASLPVVTRYADVGRLGTSAQRFFNLECMSSDLYSMCLPETQPCGYEQRLSAAFYRENDMRE